MTGWSDGTASYQLRPEHAAFLRDLRARVFEEMQGIDGVVNALIVALITRGHILLEGNPGLGKTALVKSLSRALGMHPSAVGRIQFTPDLMPSDITGTRMPSEGDRTRLEFRRGPIFHQLLLADEINRATPKTQAAMLEAMAEFQVTVLGERKPLTRLVDVGLIHDAATPFMVMATQNPVEQEGTYPLPEAQLDRFMMKVVMPFPSAETLSFIVSKDSGKMHEPVVETTAEHNPSSLALDDNRDLLRLLSETERAIRNSRPTDAVARHIINIVMASTGKFDEVRDLRRDRADALRTLAAEVDYPLGPRAATALTLGTLGWAAAVEAEPAQAGRFSDHSTVALARVLVPVLRHRIGFRTGLSGFGTEQEGEEYQALTDARIRALAQAAAPDTHDYAAQFDAALSHADEVPL